jgi:hypothetical protein
MKARTETLLEGGFVLLSAGVLTGFGALLVGRALGERDRRRRHTERPPERDSVPVQRHLHGSPSPR